MKSKDNKDLNILIRLVYRFESDKKKNEDEEDEEEEEYDENEYFSSINKWRIFGEKFVFNNEKFFTFIYNGNEIKLREMLPYDKNDKNVNKENEFYTIILKQKNKITNMNYMFKDCISLYSIQDISKLDTSEVTTMRGLFYGCKSLSNIFGISEWNTSKVTDMSNMFYNCKSLSFLNISKWNTCKVTDMNDMFYNCESLSFLDISKWNTSKVTKIGSMFYQCKSLSFLPNVIEWKIPKYYNINHLKNIYIDSWDYFKNDECINAINIK